jgi:hypothetical protein
VNRKRVSEIVDVINVVGLIVQELVLVKSVETLDVGEIVNVSNVIR